MPQLVASYLHYLDAAQQALQVQPVDPAGLTRSSERIDASLTGSRDNARQVARSWQGAGAGSFTAAGQRPSPVPGFRAPRVATLVDEVRQVAERGHGTVGRIRQAFVGVARVLATPTGNPTVDALRQQALQRVGDQAVSLAGAQVQTYEKTAIRNAAEIRQLAGRAPATRSAVGPRPPRGRDTGVPRPAKPLWHPDVLLGTEPWHMVSTPSIDRDGHAIWADLDFTKENGYLRIEGRIEASKYVDDGRVPLRTTIETYLYVRDGQRVPIGMTVNATGHVDSAGKPDGGGSVGLGSNPQYAPNSGAMSRHPVREETWYYSQDVSRVIDMPGLNDIRVPDPTVARPTISSLVTWEYGPDGQGDRLVSREFRVPLSVPRDGLAGFLYNGPQPVRLR